MFDNNVMTSFSLETGKITGWPWPGTNSARINNWRIGGFCYSASHFGRTCLRFV